MEEQVLFTLLNNERYFSKVYSHLSNSLFERPESLVIFDSIKELVNKYGNRPSLKEVAFNIKESVNIKEPVKNSTIEFIKNNAKNTIDNIDFMLDKTELWIKKQKLTSSVFKAADIIKKEGEFGPIISMFEDSLKVSFDTSIGLDYNESVDERLSYYKSIEAFTPIGIPTLDSMLGGGIRPSSLFMFIGASHSGKTAAKVFSTANLLLKKENVLYITLEMPEKEIAKRIDASLLGLQINELTTMDNDIIKNKIKQLDGIIGKLVIKEYGAGTFNVIMLRNLLDDLKAKKGFIPDSIVIDYLGLMVSHRASISSNSYDQLGKVAEDLHAISKEYYDSKGNKGIKIISSGQGNRSSVNQTEVDMANISESLKIAMTADVLIFIITNDQLKENKQQIWKLIKNRYTGNLSSLMVNTDFPRMRYSDVSDGLSNNPMQEIKDFNLQPSITPSNLDFSGFNF